MLLLFTLEAEFYAVDTDSVVEILPMVMLRKISSASEYLAGVFNYHGSVVPVVDLSRIIRGTQCHSCYSTRIILVQNVDSGVMKSTTAPLPLVGLMAERVTGTLKLSAASPAANPPPSATRWGDLLITEAGLIQTIHWQRLSEVLSDCFDRREPLNGAAVG